MTHHSSARPKARRNPRKGYPGVRRARGLAGLAFASAAVLTLAGCSPQAGDSTSPGGATAAVAQGSIEGVAAEGVDAFLGLPYAAPPVDDLRFKAPEPPEAWEGTKKADAFGPACLQGGEVVGVEKSEDCLYLNVYRPSGVDADAELPVMMWIHGGGFGGGSGALFDPSEFVERTNTVVVNINYRLGALGYLASESMGADAGSFGLLDQVAALDWVNENIAAFGGDPARVTAAGQSAGAMSICGLLTSPETTGMLSGAILQSGSCAFRAFTPFEAAVEAGNTTAAEIGCPAGAAQLECLQGLDAEVLMETPGRFSPTFGSDVLPAMPMDAIEAGDWDAIPVLAGSNRWEGKQGIFFSVGPDAGSMTAEEYEARVRETYAEKADDVLQRYPAGDYDQPALALAAIDTDSTFGCSTFTFAEGAADQATIYAYEFEDPTSPTNAGMALDGIDMSSAHSAELAYLFDYAEVERPLTAEEKELGYRMMDYWAEFLTSGTLGSPWVAFTAEAPTFIKLTPEGEKPFEDFATEHQCEFWASMS